MKNSSLLPVLAGLILSACATKEADPVRIVDADEVFYATIEDLSSRVFVDDGLRVLWNADDRISIFNRYTYNRQYRFDGKDGENSGSFTLVPDDAFVVGNSLDKVYAVYPYREDTRITNDGEITVTLPSEQSYRVNSFGLGSNTMVSVTEDNYLLFKNLCGYLTVRLFGENVSISSISIRGNNAEPLAGQATVVAQADQAPSLTFDAEATQELTIHFDTPVLLGDSVENATAFWLVVPPVTFSKGITMTVTDDQGGQFVKSASISFTIGRNHLSRMAPLRVGAPVPGEVTGISLDKTELTLIVGQSAELLATVRPEDATDKTVTWTSSDESVATVDDEGRVTAVTPGTATITANASGRTATCIVTVKNRDENAPIQFADARLKKELVDRFDLDKDGELSYKEAAAVPSENMKYAILDVETMKLITSFEEFQYFTGVTTLPEEFFVNWTSLCSIVLPPSLASVSNKAFLGCPALKSVVISEGPVSIGRSAFENCPNLSSVVLPTTLTRIDHYAFRDCISLSSILLPDALESMGESVFYGCASLKSVVIPSRIKSLDWLSFANCTSLSSISLPDGLKTIGAYALDGCKSLLTLVIPEGVVEIGESAIRNCENLTSIHLPESLIWIRQTVFNGCASLESIVIPSGVTSLGERPFEGCSKLTSLVISADNPVYDSRKNCNAVIKTETGELLWGCSGTVIPDGVTRIGAKAFFNNTGPSSLLIPGSVGSIGESAFENCTDLSSVIMSEGVKSIESFAFRKCQSLSLVILPQTLEEMKLYAFANCSALTSIEIPSSLSHIGDYAFRYCSSLSSLSISEGVEYIGPAAFAQCVSLTSAIIPSTVKTIGSSVFEADENLSFVQVNAISPPEAGLDIFSRRSNYPIYVPAGSLEAYKAANRWKEYASRIMPIEP